MTEQSPVRVLHVEDNPRVIELTRLHLESKNTSFKITAVLSASQALEKLDTANFDVVVSDYAMPEMNGIEFLEALRKSGDNIPFIILTGKGREKEAIEALNKGANRYLKKGGDSDVLFDTLVHYIQDVIEERRKEDELALKTKELEAANRDLEATNRQVQELIERANQMALETEIAYVELDQIFNSARGGMCVIDNDFNVIRINKSYSTLSGISRDNAVGKKCFEVSHNNLCHTPNCPLMRILNGEEHIECEVEKECTDGIGNTRILTATPFRGLDGELTGIIEDFTDVTKRKRVEDLARNAGEDWRKTFRSQDYIMLVIDRDYNIEHINDNGLKLLGKSEEEVIGKKCYQLFNDK